MVWARSRASRSSAVAARLAVVAVFLTMTNRSAEMHAIDSADGEQGDFEIEVHHPLDDHPSGASAAALLRIAPLR